jgi:WD40 repeat protein
MWRSIIVAAAFLPISACGSSDPTATTAGPRISASLAAVWPSSGPARQVAFSRDGTLLATSDASGAITIRRTHDWRVVEQLNHPGGAVTVAFGNDDAHLFSGGYDGTVREWDLARRSEARAFKASAATVWTIDISPDGNQLAAAGEDAVIRIWHLDRPARPMALRGHGRNVWQVRFSPDGKRLASGSFDHDARLWDAKSGRALRTLSGHRQAVVGLDFSPDGKLLVTGGDDSTLRYWRASDGMPLRTIDNGTHVDMIAFSPDGQWVASGGHPHGAVVELWHQLTGGGGEGDAVRIWRAKDAALVAGLPHPEEAYLVAFSRDGRWLVTSGEDNHFRLWRLQSVGA